MKVKDIAKKLNVSKAYIYKLIREKKLKPSKVIKKLSRNFYEINEDDVKNLRVEIQKK